MLKKLLKYDLKNMFKFISIFYLLAIFFAILTRIFFSLEQTLIIKIIGQICVGAMFSMIASSIINTLMRSWIRFKETIYGDESYLIHTLPVTKKTLFESKFILHFLTLTCTLLFSLIAIFIAYYSKDNINILNSLLSNITSNLNISNSLFIFVIIFILALEIFAGLESEILEIIFGYKKSNNKVLYSVIFGFLVYILSQLFILLSLFITGLFNKNVMNIFTSSIIDFNTIKIIVIISILIYILIIAMLNFISVKELKKGVNVM
jgi:hypothetical protein